MDLGSISRQRVEQLRERELARFAELRPRGQQALERARASMPNGVPMAWMTAAYEHPPIVVDRGRVGGFRDVDGLEYADFNLADMSTFGGYGNEAFARVVAERGASGPQFLLPTEDAAIVAEELARRFGMPFWQFTLSATIANTEAIRVARAATGRAAVVMFDGKYHGHADELLGEVRDGHVAPDGLGVPADATRHVRLVAYNDLEAVERELARGDVACVLAEAAITNVGVIQPADGFHAGLRQLVSDAGALLVLDETHTLVSGPGGLTARWGLEPDLLVVGKAIAGGVPLGAYGMTPQLAGLLDNPDATWGEGIATGGTLFGNALSMAAARATLTEVLTDDVYERSAAMGQRLADGIETAIAAHDLPWSVHRLFNRSGYTHAPELPVNAAQARATFDTDLYNVQRVYMANRGVWEAIDSAGPACGTQTTAEQVDLYLEVLASFLDAACDGH